MGDQECYHEKGTSNEWWSSCWKRTAPRRELKSPSFRVEYLMQVPCCWLRRIKIYWWPTCWCWWWRRHERKDDDKEDVEGPRNRTRLFKIGIPHCPYPPFWFNTSSRPPPLHPVRRWDVEEIRRRILPSAERRTRGRVVGISFPEIRWFLITPAELSSLTTPLFLWSKDPFTTLSFVILNYFVADKWFPIINRVHPRIEI